MTQLIPAGTSVRYAGEPATVIHGNEPGGWTADGQPGATVNIRFDSPVRGMSRQLDVFATSVLPA